MTNEISVTSNETSLIQQLKQHTDINGLARSFAFNSTVSLGNLIPPSVSFDSSGLTLVLGNAECLGQFAAQIPSSHYAKVVLLCLISPQSATSIPAGIIAPEIPLFYSQDVEISGFLGAFTVNVTIDSQLQSLSKIAKGQAQFDLIIDLTEQGVHKAQLPPVGYYAVGRGLISKEKALDCVEEMKGVFDKPKFFRLDTARCAHTSRSLEGCTRCIDACPADALSVENKVITINPYLCQGVGSCAMACPTEAISYALPDSVDTQHYIYQLLQCYQQANGQSPVILFYAASCESELREKQAMFNSNVLPIQLEELASVGIDTWFCALAYGAVQILLLETSNLHQKTRRVLNKELEIADIFLTKLGMSSTQISMISLDLLSQFRCDIPVPATASEKLRGSKRDKLAAALDFLAEKHDFDNALSSLPSDAPFGRIDIDDNGCTLCLSCVAVCPTNALQSIGTHPGMSFKEQDCVQCGLCQNACPESVISLTPRYNWETQTRQAREILHQEAAAECLRCGKPFAPASMVNMLIEKLRDHSQFQADAITRLSMCEDCRVRDIFSGMLDDPEQQLKM